MFVQIWCWNFLAKIFLCPAKNFGGGGVLLHLSKSDVRIFWLKFFFGWPKILDGGYFHIYPNLVLEFFSQNFFSASQKFWRGSFTFVQIWCWNFLAKIFLWPAKISEGGGVLSHLSKSDVRILWLKYFFGWPKILDGGTLTFVQIWCRNFLAKFFCGQPKSLEGGGVLLHLSKSDVRIFWLKYFFGWPKILDGGTFTFVQIWCWNFLAKIFFWPAENFGGGYFYVSPKMTWEFFPNHGGYQI